MKRSVILPVVVRLCLGPVWAYSFYLLFVGHNNPGGGFIAGLVSLAAVALQMMTFGRATVACWLSLSRPLLISAGLGMATITGIGSWLLGYPFLTSAVLRFELPILGTIMISTATFFDMGVYAVVLGSGTTILLLFGDPHYE